MHTSPLEDDDLFESEIMSEQIQEKDVEKVVAQAVRNSMRARGVEEGSAGEVWPLCR
jgi:hypothetical protein